MQFATHDSVLYWNQATLVTTPNDNIAVTAVRALDIYKLFVFAMETMSWVRNCEEKNIAPTTEVYVKCARCVFIKFPTENNFHVEAMVHSNAWFMGPWIKLSFSFNILLS